MLDTPSRFRGANYWAEAVSPDGRAWAPAPAHVQTSGKWALVLDHLELVDETIDLNEYEIALGPSEGKPATVYLRGQSDKACVRRSQPVGAPDHRQVVMLGRLVAPWAVFLRTPKPANSLN